MLNPLPRPFIRLATVVVTPFVFGGVMACGTAPASPTDVVDSGVDATESGDALVSDVSAPDGSELDTAPDSSELDTAPDAIEMDTAPPDVVIPPDVVPPPDVLTPDVGPDVPVCAGDIVCVTAAGEALEDGAEIMVFDRLSCSVLAEDSNEGLWGLFWEFDGVGFSLGVAEEGSPSSFRPPVVGAFQVFAARGDCRIDGPVYRGTPRPTGTFVMLEWGGESTVPQSVDLDLGVYRIPDPCSGIPALFLSGYTGESSDWGEPGDASDDPNAGWDFQDPPGRETLWWDRVATDETWTVVVLGQNGAENALMPRLSIYQDGELALERVQSLEAQAHWTAAHVSEAGVVAIDTVGARPPECGPEYCPDGSLRGIEVCNGLDDDCDGLRDERSDVCRDAEGEVTGECSYAPGSGTWACRQ